MSGFIATGPAPSAGKTLENISFFPDIELDELRATLRLDGSITDGRLSAAAVAAILTVNADLAPLSMRHADSNTALADLDAPLIAGTSALVHLYQRAIACTVGAELAERYRSYDSTNSGNSAADELTPSIDEYRRDARYAIRDLLQRVRITVELI